MQSVASVKQLALTVFATSVMGYKTMQHLIMEGGRTPKPAKTLLGP